MRRRLIHLASLICLFVLFTIVPSPATPAKQTHAASLTQPNVILILTDDQTMESVAKMPYLSSRTDWLTFDNAFENTALCCPSRATILTGQYDTHTGVLNNAGSHNGTALNEANTLPVWLHQAGYHNALIGKYLNAYPWKRGNYTPSGWDEWDAFNSTPGYYNYSLNQNGTTVTYGSTEAEYSTDVFANLAANFVNTAQPPFFLYFAPHAPHSPFIPAPKYTGFYAKTPVIHDPSFNEADVSDKPAFIQALSPLKATRMDNDRRHQWEMMLSVDDAIKSLDDTLIARGLYDNTIEIFMTDNGYAHGEHRWEMKRCEYDVCSRTPLLIRYPGQAARHITQLVENIDLAPTIANFAGVIPGMTEDGMSLMPLIEQTAPTWRDALLQHWGGGGQVQRGNPPNFWAIRTATYRYVELVTGQKELYDYSVDPYELNNKAGNPDYAAIQANLAARLAILKGQAQRGHSIPDIKSNDVPIEED